MSGSVGSEDGDVGFQIAPMVDVVFVLMLFFMASAGAQIVALELSIDLPSGRSASTTEQETVPITIDISADGAIMANGNPMDFPDTRELPQLTGFLRANVEQFGGKDPVIVKPSPDANHQRVMDVLNAAAAAKVTKLTFN